jgi:hypothetical protein
LVEMRASLAGTAEKIAAYSRDLQIFREKLESTGSEHRMHVV